LWEVLAGIYDDLGLDRLGDATFRALVLARVIEPASKLDTVRVLTEIGVAPDFGHGALGFRAVVL